MSVQFPTPLALAGVKTAKYLWRCPGKLMSMLKWCRQSVFTSKPGEVAMQSPLPQVLKLVCAAVVAYGLLVLGFALLQYAILPALIAITGGGP